MNRVCNYVQYLCITNGGIITDCPIGQLSMPPHQVWYVIWLHQVINAELLKLCEQLLHHLCSLWESIVQTYHHILDPFTWSVLLITCLQYLNNTITYYIRNWCSDYAVLYGQTAFFFWVWAGKKDLVTCQIFLLENQQCSTSWKQVLMLVCDFNVAAAAAQ